MMKYRGPIIAVTTAIVSLPLLVGMNAVPKAGLADAAVQGSVAAHQVEARPNSLALVAGAATGKTGTVRILDNSHTTGADPVKSADAAASTDSSSSAQKGTDASTPVIGDQTTVPDIDDPAPAVDIDDPAPAVDTAAPVINGAAYGPLKGVQTLTLSQTEDSPQKTYVEIQQKDAGGTWRKHTGEWFFATNTFAFSVNTDALADGPDTQLKVSTWDATGNHASATFPVTIDRVKPIATLVTPTSSAPQADSTLNIELDATDDHGLQRLTANIYQGGTLVRSTSSSASGATHASHRAAVTLPDGEYTIRYNASDLAGNIASTGQRAVEIDTTAPVITVKDGASVVNGIYNAVPSFKLMDQGVGEVDYVIANGVTYDRTNNKWSDLNAGNYHAVQGENVITLVDTAGNSTSFTFVLDNAAPVITVKDGASVVNGIYNTVPSFKLMDQGAGQVDYVTANGVTYDRTNNKWSDLNAGNYHAVQGKNVITLVDTAGNKTSFTFELDTVAPKVVDISQKYEQKEGGRTAVTLTFSEPIDGASLGQGWYGSGTTFTKVYYREKVQSVSFLDKAGNTGSDEFTAQKPAADGSKEKQASEETGNANTQASTAEKQGVTADEKAHATKAAAGVETAGKKKTQDRADEVEAAGKATSTDSKSAAQVETSSHGDDDEATNTATES